jgi:hypothetical protein
MCDIGFGEDFLVYNVKYRLACLSTCVAVFLFKTVSTVKKGEKL